MLLLVLALLEVVFEDVLSVRSSGSWCWHLSGAFGGSCWGCVVCKKHGFLVLLPVLVLREPAAGKVRGSELVFRLTPVYL